MAPAGDVSEALLEFMEDWLDQLDPVCFKIVRGTGATVRPSLRRIDSPGLSLATGRTGHKKGTIAKQRPKK
jgi:hypothetical protein